MKATIELLPTGRYDVMGLRTPACKPLAIDNGKETYEIFVLRSFCGKTYKTLENAIKAIHAKGLEYIPANAINTVIGWD